MGRNEAKDLIQPFVPLILEAGRIYGIAPRIIGGLIFTESSGNPWAIRVERGFWQRYGENVKRDVARSSSRYDDKWTRYPDIVSCSYGLCQIMLPVAWENGFSSQFPTELLDPKTNINLGSKILSRHLDKFGSIEKALLRYNGGGDLEYPIRVEDAARKTQDLFAVN